MKKVLFSITTLFGGGAERVVSVWANQLSLAGYDVSVLLYGRCENEYHIEDSVKIYTVADTYQDYQKLPYFKRVLKMRSKIKQIKPDINISFLPRMQIWVMFASIGLRFKRIETVRVSPWSVCRKSKFEKALWKKCFSLADKIIVQTAEQAEFFNAKNQKKCVVIPNPIAKQYVENKKTDYKECPINFIAAGRVMEQKNYGMMITAFANAVKEKPDLKLSIFGEGNLLEKMNFLIKELNMENNITFMGRSNNMCEEFLNSDAFLMSSNHEGMPNALAEAMATGLVCVSTDCRTGPKDLIDDGTNGFLVSTGNIEEMTKAILKVAELSKEESMKIGVSARAKILSFCSEENSFKRLVDLLEN